MVRCKRCPTALLHVSHSSPAIHKFLLNRLSNHVLNLAVKDFLNALGELAEEDVEEFERNWSLEDIRLDNLDEQIDIEVLNALAQHVVCYEQSIAPEGTVLYSKLIDLKITHTLHRIQ